MDGGGIRGILTARLLERIEAEMPGFLMHVDLFAGTSTGGLLALGLAGGKSPGELRQLYQTLAKRVFADSLIDQLKDLGNLVGAEFSFEPLKEVLEEQFGAATLAELYFRVLIPTFQLDNKAAGRGKVRAWKMKLFHNYPGPDSDGKERVVDVGVRTSVAPAYFPTYQGYIDGGVAASNPAMCAVAQALDARAGQQRLEDLRLLSFGTGYNPRHLPLEDADWGLVQWAPHLLYVMLESSIGLVDFQCRQLLESRYFRMDPTLPFEIGLGSIQYIPELLEAAERANLSSTLKWIERNFA
jgi:patatin-like phospholipase/acyl hydrolase